MSFAFAAVAFAPGLAVGSFLNVVASRVPLRRPIGTAGRACMSCCARDRAYDNIPLVSWRSSAAAAAPAAPRSRGATRPSSS